MTADGTGKRDETDPAALLAKLEAIAAGAKEADPTDAGPVSDSENPISDDGVRPCLTFSIGGTVYALEANVIREVLRDPPLARVPRAEAELAGVMNLRGTVLPVFDILPLLGLARQSGAGAPFVIVLGQDDRVMGLCVDSVHDLVGIACASITPVKSPMEKDAGLQRGTTQHAITVLDGDILLRQAAGRQERAS